LLNLTSSAVTGSGTEVANFLLGRSATSPQNKFFKKFVRATVLYTKRFSHYFKFFHQKQSHFIIFFHLLP